MISGTPAGSAGSDDPRRAVRRLAIAIAILIPLGLACSSDLPMKPLAEVEVSGVISDPEGSGVGGIEVWFRVPQGSHIYTAFRAPTDNAGAFIIRIPEGLYHLTLRDGNFPARFPRVEIEGIRIAPPASRINYRFSGFRVQGQLTGPGGSAVYDGTVSALNLDPSVDYYVQAQVSSQRYKLFLPAGSYYLRARPSPAYPGVPTVFFSNVSISSDTTLDLALDGHSITGTATIGAGTPIDDATVLAVGGNANANAKTAPDGTYQMYLPSGDYDWTVIPGLTARNVIPRRQAGPGISGPTTLDFDLSGVRWTGTVRLTTTSAPIASVDVAVRESRSYDTATSTSDATGQYALVLRPGTRYDLTLSSGIVGINARTIYGVLAGNDSTFDLYVEPATP